jgi:tetratricopeptide (TPR) repeat protein
MKKLSKNILSGFKWHQLSEKAREQDKHPEALEFIEEAIVNYQQEKNYEGLSQALQSRFLIYKHLFLLTKDNIFAFMGQKDVETSFWIAQQYNLQKIISSCYFRLGESAMLFENYKEAVKQYQKAVDNFYGFKAEKGDYRYHLGEALYRSGKKEEGKEKMLQGLQEIQKNKKGIDPFLIHVWESGCYLRLVELLKNDEPEEARKYLRQAEKIVNSDKKLIIRRRQTKELAKKF